jgi:hypothetical protein
MDQLEFRIEELQTSTNALQKKVGDQQKMLSDLKEQYRRHIEENTRRWDFNKLKGKFCMFWDREDEYTHEPRGGLIRKFSRREYRAQEAPGHHDRFYAMSLLGKEEEVAHGWKHIRPLTYEDVVGNLILNTEEYLLKTKSTLGEW